jgi:hypothetical protein|tara:strand:+ start:566 stop:709 length:144 start_codon:yes stop_codon:yes gene_type:complete
MVWDEFKTEYLIDGGASVLIDRASVKEVDGSTRRSRRGDRVDDRVWF